MEGEAADEEEDQEENEEGPPHGDGGGKVDGEVWDRGRLVR